MVHLRGNGIQKSMPIYTLGNFFYFVLWQSRSNSLQYIFLSYPLTGLIRLYIFSPSSFSVNSSLRGSSVIFIIWPLIGSAIDLLLSLPSSLVLRSRGRCALLLDDCARIFRRGAVRRRRPANSDGHAFLGERRNQVSVHIDHRLIVECAPNDAEKRRQIDEGEEKKNRSREKCAPDRRGRGAGCRIRAERRLTRVIISRLTLLNPNRRGVSLNDDLPLTLLKEAVRYCS